MKQYRFTSSNYVPEEPTIPDAVMDSADLVRIQQLAGIAKISSVTEDAMTNGGHLSPVGSNISATGMKNQQLEREHNIKPGTPEWFQLWFSKPYLTGEKPTDEKSDGKAPKNTLFSRNTD